MDPTAGPVSAEVNREGLGIEAYREQLLPGIPDHLTSREIVPKLQWKSLCSLTLVSPAWLHAMQNCEIYQDRVFYSGLESLVLLRYHTYWFESLERLALYSIRDGLYFEVPPLPNCQLADCECEPGIPVYCYNYAVLRIPYYCKCVTLDGKLYVLGGRDRHVYALDLAGPKRQWIRCASMLRMKTYGFECGAFDGKIYAFEKCWFNHLGLEVYDPKEDTWSLIDQPKPFRPFLYTWGGAVGEELVLLFLNDEDLEQDFEYVADVYHPGKDEWREVKVKDDGWGELFSAQGKLHLMGDGCIFVLDMDTGRWMLKHRYSFAGGAVEQVRSVTSVGDELFLLGTSDFYTFIFHSEGFGGKNTDIFWHDYEHYPSYTHGYSITEIHPIEL